MRLIGNIPVLYEDKWLLAVDKPAGLLTIPTPKKEKRTLTSILGFYPCHRLDRETSGIILYAKAKSYQRRMMEEFRRKRVNKQYIAFVQGCPAQQTGQISLPIEGKPALTKYKVLEQRRDFAIMGAEPLTGRTNQLRIHFKAIGHPIVGETKYAFRKDFALRAKRLCLQAKALSFIHPVSAKAVSLETGLAADLREFLKTHA
jgi:RluA family pseudouridine synthase